MCKQRLDFFALMKEIWSHAASAKIQLHPSYLCISCTGLQIDMRRKALSFGRTWSLLPHQRNILLEILARAFGFWYREHMPLCLTDGFQRGEAAADK